MAAGDNQDGLAGFIRVLPAISAMIALIVLIIIMRAALADLGSPRSIGAMAIALLAAFIVGSAVRYLLLERESPPARRTLANMEGAAADRSGLSGLSPAMAAFVTLLPALTALLITAILIWRSQLVFTSFADAATLNALGLVALFCLGGLAVGYGVRQLLPLAPPPPDDGNTDRNRSQIARWVVTAGTIGIFVTALTIIVMTPRGDADRWAERVTAIFTAVLPVFATWVGTVLAFYFTNESYRQAAQVSQGLTAAPGAELITKSGVMYPFERIVRKELSAAELTGKTPVEAAEALKLKEIGDLFGPMAIRRLVIFDDKRVPIFVIRRSGMPASPTANATLKDYLDLGTNRTAATAFERMASTATIADAKRMVESGRVTDIFVTEHGRNDEAAIGWVPDDNLRG